jgi:hypothetical protein
MGAPRHLAHYYARMEKLRVVEPPIYIKPYAVCQFWHPRFDTDPSLKWLRESVASLFTKPSRVALASAATKIPEKALQGWLFTNKGYYRPPEGLLDVAGLQRNLKTMQSIGFLKERIDAAKYVDMSLIREAAARLK